MPTPGQPPHGANLSDDVADEGVFETVRDAYEAVYDALSHSPTFSRIWRANAYHGEFPLEFAHVSFLTLDEAQLVLKGLALRAGSVLVDAACGAGGPGLWAARQTGASLIGIDPAASAIRAAQQRAEAAGMASSSRFLRGTFEHMGVPDATADSMMTIEAFQYAPDKRAALREFRRVLKPAGRLALVCFEVDPAKADGLPVLGVDPIADYVPLLEECGFRVDEYNETPGWETRVYAAFGAIVEASETLTVEMGERAAAGAIAEAMLTLAMKPYPRRILGVATRV